MSHKITQRSILAPLTGDASNRRDSASLIQRKQTISSPTASADSSTAAHAVGRHGSRVSTDARSGFEPPFGHDFSRVPVHVDSAPVRASTGERAAFSSNQSRPTAGRGAADPVAFSRASGADAVRAAAQRGIDTPSTALPYADAIQKSFGRTHDISHVRTHIGGAAADACRDMNASAYAAGSHVAFITSPDLKTAAHEAAHVVQQKHGVNLRGGVGEADDIYERHADAVADRVVAGRSAANLLPLGPSVSAYAGGRGEHAGNATVSGPVHAVQRTSGLLPPEKVQEVYGAWVRELFKARGTEVLTDAIDHDAREQVKTQVGPANFTSWERWEQALQEKNQAEGDAANPKPEETKPINAQAQMAERHDQMWEDTNGLRAEIEQTEYLAQKLNFGGGVKGSMARITAGAYIGTWGIGARTINSVVDHAPMIVVSTVATGLGSELGERTLANQGKAVAQEGGEMGDDARTAVRLVGGNLQAAFEATRPSYNSYRKAFSDFSEASRKFTKDLQIGGMAGYGPQAQDIADMDAAMKAMRETGNEYLMACAKMGIQTDAQALDKAGEHVVKSSQETVLTVATTVLPEAGAGFSELKSAFKGAEGLSAKQLEREATEQVAASIAKTGDEAAVSSGSKSAIRTGEDAAVKPSMPHGSSSAAASGEEAVLASHPASPGHEVEVTAAGVKVCSPPPCPVLEVAYAAELKAAPELASELEEVNQLRKVDPDKAAEKAAALQTKLEGVRTRLAGGNAPSPAGAAKVDPLDQKIADAQNELAESRGKLIDYKEERAAAGKSLKGGPSKGVWNAKERLWLLQRQKVYPDRQMLEQVTIVGVKDAGGEMKAAAAFGQEGRILDFAEIQGNRVNAGDLKSKEELIGSVAGGVKKGPTTGTIKPKSKLGQQIVKEDALMNDAVSKNGKLVLQGRDVRTDQIVTIEVDPGNFNSTVVTYDDLGGN